MSLKPPDDLTAGVPSFLASWDQGDSQSYGIVSTEGQLLNLSRGTDSSPDTEPNPLLKVERLCAHLEEDVSAGSAHQEMAAIFGIAVGTEDCEKQPIGVLGQAKTSANTDPANTSDALGVAGQARMLSGAVGSGLGGYFEGRKDSGVDSGCSIAGISIQAQNQTGSDDSYVSNGTGGNSAGIVLISGGTDRAACAMSIYRPTSAEQWDVGIGFTSANGGAVLTAGIRMDDSAVTAIDINGTRTNGIDMSDAIFSGNAIKLNRTGDAAGGIDFDGPTLYAVDGTHLKTSHHFEVALSLTVLGGVDIQSTNGSGYIEMTEQSSDPAAPAANQGRLFFKDNGSGKTQLVVRFPTGANQVVATEP